MLKRIVPGDGSRFQRHGDNSRQAVGGALDFFERHHRVGRIGYLRGGALGLTLRSRRRAAVRFG